MGLRTRMFLVVGGAATLFILLLYFISRLVLLRSFADLEERDVKAHLDRARGALSAKVASIDTLASDWASWDDTYAFIEELNEPYLTSNLVDDTFRNGRLHVLALLDTEGSLAYAKGYDLESDHPAPLSTALQERLPSDDLLWKHDDSLAGIMGVLSLPEGLMLVSSKPILTSEGEGPARGALLMGRYLNDQEIALLREETGLDMTIRKLDDDQPSSEDGLTAASFPGENPIVIQAQGRNEVSGHFLLSDIHDQPVGVLSVSLPRVIYSQGTRTVAYVLVSVVLGGFLLFILQTLLTDKWIISRIAVLDATVERIASTGDLSQRLTLPGKDEVGSLASRINNMLAELGEAHEALREANSELQALIRSSPLAIFTLDLAGNVLSWNPAAERMFGWSEQEVLGKPLPIVPDDKRSESAALRGRVARGEAFTGVELRRRNKDGSAIDVSLSTAPMYDATGHVTAIMGVMADITEHKRAEEQLWLAQYSVHHSAIATFWIGPDARVLRANMAARDLLGYTEEELSKRAVYDIDPNCLSEHWPDHWRELRRRGTMTFESQYMAKDGRVLPVEITANYLEFGGKEYSFAFVHDITERKRLEQQLLQAQKTEAIGQLAGGVAHDFNNLLTVINGYCDLILRSMGEGTPLRFELQEIRHAGNRAAELTRQLLAFGRKQMLEMRVLDLNEVLDGLGKMLQRIIGEDIALEMKLARDLGHIKADPGQIEQVVVNLAANARDAMPHGGRLALETANVTADENFARQHEMPLGEYVMLSISDTGVGMSDEIKDHLFEPFYTTKEVGKGTGLGLATVYGIVKQHQGSIWVYSEPGQGTRFAIYLPCVKESGEQLLPLEEGAELPRGSETILVVEDEQTVRTITVRTLIGLGYQVLDASNGMQALQIAQGYRDAIHLLLTDMIMPEMDGSTLAEQLGTARPGLKVLFVSGYTDRMPLPQRVLDQGAAFLQKPFNAASLAHKVRQVLDNQNP